MRRVTFLRLTLCLGLAEAPALAQPADLAIAPATTHVFPAGIHVVQTPKGALYADAKGRLLYGMDMRVLLLSGPDPSKHCDAKCAAIWEPLLAPGKAPNIRYSHGLGERPPSTSAGQSKADFYTQQNAPDWTVIAGPQGPQWVYKGWHMVFVRRGPDARSASFDGAENRTWNTLKYIPPAPTIVAPSGIKPVLLDGAYALADAGGHILYTGACGKKCAAWKPFGAGMASAPVGQWAVSRSGDSPRWSWRGRPVFVATDDDPTSIPASAWALRP